MKVVVRTFKNEFQFEAQPSMKGRDLYNLVAKSLGIHESWYFGIMYQENETEIWIDKSKKSLKDLEKYVNQLQFKVKFYPENICEELIEKVTIEFFFAETKSNILSDVIYCPSDTAALLASYALQAKFGDYDPNKIDEKAFKKVKLVPERVLKQHSMNLSEWQNSIINLWKKHQDLEDEEAMLEYLRLVQNLELYGVSFFLIQNKKKTDVLLGVTALGLNIYKKDDKLNPQISFPWSEIKNLSTRDRKFIIRPTDKTAKEFAFITKTQRISKTILNLGIGNHTLYVKRRKDESPEIAAMREKNMEIRRNKKNQNQKLNNERRAREEAERREKEYKDQIQAMLEQVASSQAALLEAQKTIKQLQEQLDQLQSSKEELEQQRRALEEMMQRLEQNKNLEAAERQKLEDEIQAKHEEVQRIQEEVRLKDEETRRLQEEVEEARRREEEIRLEQMQVAERLAAEKLQREEAERLEAERRRVKEEEYAKQKEAGATLQNQEVSKDIQNELKLLQNKLEETRAESEETQMDKLHRANLVLGKDKFKTLADIRRGNTIRRIELFENI